MALSCWIPVLPKDPPANKSLKCVSNQPQLWAGGSGLASESPQEAHKHTKGVQGLKGLGELRCPRACHQVASTQERKFRFRVLGLRGVEGLGGGLGFRVWGEGGGCWYRKLRGTVEGYRQGATKGYATPACIPYSPHPILSTCTCRSRVRLETMSFEAFTDLACHPYHLVRLSKHPKSLRANVQQPPRMNRRRARQCLQAVAVTITTSINCPAGLRFVLLNAPWTIAL